MKSLVTPPCINQPLLFDLDDVGCTQRIPWRFLISHVFQDFHGVYDAETLCYELCEGALYVMQ